VIYGALKRGLLRLLKAPAEPPDPPAGSHASVRVFRASPRFLTYRLVGVLLLSLVLFGVWAAAGISILVEGEPVALLLLPPLGAVLTLVVFLSYVAVRIDYDMRYYIVTDRSIRIREGAFVIQEKTLTHANVQNLNVLQGPLQRLFGIKSLAVDTAGGGGGGGDAHGHGRAQNQHRFELAGIENAAEVRDLVLEHLRRGARDSGLGDLDDAGERARGAVPPSFEAGPAVLAALADVRAAAAALRRAAEATG
jgi:membrane protein YdbS with pleckstrin-like domain